MFTSIKNFFNPNSGELRPFVFKFGNKGLGYSIKNNPNIFFENPCVNRALNLIVNGISKLEVVVIKDGRIDKECLVYNVIKNSSNGFYFSEFIESFVFNYLLYGNAFILLENNFLRNLSVLDVDVHIDKLSRFVSYYSIKINEKESLNVSFDGNDSTYVGHFKNFNPKDPIFGYSILESIQMSANLYQYIDRHNLSLIQNSGRPSGIVSIDSTHPLSEAEYHEFRSSFEEQYSGPDQTGKVIFLNKEVSWQPLSGSSNEMDYNDASRRALRAIATGLGVPANLIGDMSMTGENAKSNIQAMFDIFNDITIDPLANKISQFFTMFFKKIDKDVEIKLLNKDKVRELVLSLNEEEKNI